jgi:hypothetical protein
VSLSSQENSNTSSPLAIRPTQQQQQQQQRISMENGGKLEKIISSKPNPNSSSPVLSKGAKPFDPKRNFSKLVKIDKKFVSEQSSLPPQTYLKYKPNFNEDDEEDNKSTTGENSVVDKSIGEPKTIEQREESNLKKLKSLLSRRLSLNSDRRFKHVENALVDHQTDIIKLNLINSRVSVIGFGINIPGILNSSSFRLVYRFNNLVFK